MAGHPEALKPLRRRTGTQKGGRKVSQKPKLKYLANPHRWVKQAIWSLFLSMSRMLPGRNVDSVLPEFMFIYFPQTGQTFCTFYINISILNIGNKFNFEDTGQPRQNIFRPDLAHRLQLPPVSWHVHWVREGGVAGTLPYASLSGCRWYRPLCDQDRSRQKQEPSVMVSEHDRAWTLFQQNDQMLL